LERPAENENGTVDVSLGLVVQRIMEIDEERHTMEMNGWISLSWNDYTLMWNPSEFGDIKAVRVPSEKIWIPGMFVIIKLN
jgi:hypothetical protein